MSGTPGRTEVLAPLIAGIYRGQLASFVSRRDAAVKELRAAGRRDDAATIKGLRKPTRLAWALDAACLEAPESVDRVAAAVAATLVAQSGGGDLRAALGELRASVQNFAHAASRAATDSGISVDRGELVNAIMAVVGARDAFELLRAGRLADIPEAGGLDFLAAQPSDPAASSMAGDVPSADSTARASAMREGLRRAEIDLSAARERSVAADRALRDAEAEAQNAQRRLATAQQEAQTRQAERDRARDDARRAAAQLLDAERVLAEARDGAGGG